MSVISLVIAPALKAWQVDEHSAITEWEPKSVGVGAGVFVALMVAVVLMQRNIDAGYAKKRKEVEESIAKQKAKDEARAQAVAANKAAYPEAFNALKKIMATADNGAVDASEVKALLQAVEMKPVKPVPLENPSTKDTMEVEVKQKA